MKVVGSSEDYNPPFLVDLRCAGCAWSWRCLLVSRKCQKTCGDTEWTIQSNGKRKRWSLHSKSNGGGDYGGQLLPIDPFGLCSACGLITRRVVCGHKPTSILHLQRLGSQFLYLSAESIHFHARSKTRILLSFDFEWNSICL